MPQVKIQNSVLRPNIFRYHDYRKFLKDWFEHLKETQCGFSLRNIAKDARLSCAYLPMVLANKRPLSDKSLQKLLPQMGLTPQETSYLELLQRATEADNEQVRTQAVERMQRINSYQKENPKEVETFRYLGRWFNVVIREMAQWKEFRPDPRWIQLQLRHKVSLPEIKLALEFLKENGFLKLLPNGTVQLTQKNISCVGEVFRLALRNFHREMNEISFEAIDNSQEKEHHIMGQTLSLPSSKFPRVKKILENALKQISELEEASSGSTNIIYHIQFTAAPLTKNGKGDKS